MSGQEIEIILERIAELKQDNKEDHQEIKNDYKEITIRMDESIRELKKKMGILENQVGENARKIVQNEACIEPIKKDMDRIKDKVLAGIITLLGTVGAAITALINSFLQKGG